MVGEVMWRRTGPGEDGFSPFLRRLQVDEERGDAVVLHLRLRAGEVVVVGVVLLAHLVALRTAGNAGLIIVTSLSFAGVRTGGVPVCTASPQHHDTVATFPGVVLDTSIQKLDIKASRCPSSLVSCRSLQ